MDKETLELIIAPIKEQISGFEARLSEKIDVMEKRVEKNKEDQEAKNREFGERMHEIVNKTTPQTYATILEERIEKNELEIQELKTARAVDKAVIEAKEDVSEKIKTDRQQKFDNLVKSKWIIGVVAAVLLSLLTYFVGYIQESGLHGSAKDASSSLVKK